MAEQTLHLKVTLRIYSDDDQRCFGPGIATLLVNAIGDRDYPLIQGCMLILSAIFILTNMVVDMLYGMLDPRAR